MPASLEHVDWDSAQGTPRITCGNLDAIGASLALRSASPVEQVRVASIRIGRNLGHGNRLQTNGQRNYHQYTPKHSAERNAIAARHRSRRAKNPGSIGVRNFI